MRKKAKPRQKTHAQKKGRDGQKAGYANEHRVELAIIRQKKHLPFAVQCHNAFHNGELDVLGIDALISITMAGGFIFLLQIKSSASALARHYRKHPFIPAIVAEKEMDDVKIVEEVLEIMRRQSKLPFEPEICCDAGRSLELAGLGADMLVVFQNGFGLLLRGESSEPISPIRRKKCQPLPVVVVPDNWDEKKFADELPRFIESRRKRLLELLTPKIF